MDWNRKIINCIKWRGG